MFSKIPRSKVGSIDEFSHIKERDLLINSNHMQQSSQALSEILNKVCSEISILDQKMEMIHDDHDQNQNACKSIHSSPTPPIEDIAPSPKRFLISTDLSSIEKPTPRTLESCQQFRNTILLSQPISSFFSSSSPLPLSSPSNSRTLNCFPLISLPEFCCDTCPEIPVVLLPSSQMEPMIYGSIQSLQTTVQIQFLDSHQSLVEKIPLIMFLYSPQKIQGLKKYCSQWRGNLALLGDSYGKQIKSEESLFILNEIKDIITNKLCTKILGDQQSQVEKETYELAQRMKDLDQNSLSSSFVSLIGSSYQSYQRFALECFQEFCRDQFLSFPSSSSGSNHQILQRIEKDQDRLDQSQFKSLLAQIPQPLHSVLAAFLTAQKDLIDCSKESIPPQESSGILLIYEGQGLFAFEEGQNKRTQRCYYFENPSLPLEKTPTIIETLFHFSRSSCSSSQNLDGITLVCSKVYKYRLETPINLLGLNQGLIHLSKDDFIPVAGQTCLTPLALLLTPQDQTLMKQKSQLPITRVQLAFLHPRTKTATPCFIVLLDPSSSSSRFKSNKFKSKVESTKEWIQWSRTLIHLSQTIQEIIEVEFPPFFETLTIQEKESFEKKGISLDLNQFKSHQIPLSQSFQLMQLICHQIALETLYPTLGEYITNPIHRFAIRIKTKIQEIVEKGSGETNFVKKLVDLVFSHQELILMLQEKNLSQERSENSSCLLNSQFKSESNLLNLLFQDGKGIECQVHQVCSTKKGEKKLYIDNEWIEYAHQEITQEITQLDLSQEKKDQMLSCLNLNSCHCHNDLDESPQEFCLEASQGEETIPFCFVRGKWYLIETRKETILCQVNQVWTNWVEFGKAIRVQVSQNQDQSQQESFDHDQPKKDPEMVLLDLFSSLGKSCETEKDTKSILDHSQSQQESLHQDGTNPFWTPVRLGAIGSPTKMTGDGSSRVYFCLGIHGYQNEMETCTKEFLYKISEGILSKTRQEFEYALQEKMKEAKLEKTPILKNPTLNGRFIGKAQEFWWGTLTRILVLESPSHPISSD